MTLFACEKAFEFLAEWDVLMESANVEAGWGMLMGIDDDDVRAEFAGLAALQCCSLSCEFTRRLANKMQLMPYLLFWLVWQQPEIGCPDRQGLCRDYLSFADDDLGHTAFALRRLFRG